MAQVTPHPIGGTEFDPVSPLSTSKAGIAGGRGILEKAKGNPPCRLGGHLGIPEKGRERGEGRERGAG